MIVDSTGNGAVRPEERGFTLIEVMVGMGLSMMVMAATLQLTSNAVKSQATYQVVHDANSIRNNLSLILSRDDLCVQALKGTDAAHSVITFTGVDVNLYRIDLHQPVNHAFSGTIVESNKKYPGFLETGQIVLAGGPATANAANPAYSDYLVELKVPMNKNSDLMDKGKLYGHRDIFQRVPLYMRVTTDGAGQIVSCSSQVFAGGGPGGSGPGGSGPGGSGPGGSGPGGSGPGGSGYTGGSTVL